MIWSDHDENWPLIWCKPGENWLENLIGLGQLEEFAIELDMSRNPAVIADDKVWLYTEAQRTTFTLESDPKAEKPHNTKMRFLKWNVRI